MDTFWIQRPKFGYVMDTRILDTCWIHFEYIMATFWIRTILDTLWIRCSHYPDHTSQANMTNIERESPRAVFSPKLAKTD